MVGSVDPGPQVFARGDACEVAELAGEMWLVAIAVLGGDSRPVGLGLAVELANHSLQPLHPGEALGREAHLGNEAASQGSWEHPEGGRDLADRNAPGQRLGGDRDRRVADDRAGHLVGAGAGWALTARGLFATGTDGRHWASITPPGVRPGRISGVFFLDSRHGWVAAGVRPGPARPAATRRPR